jgi:glutathione S-transferase
MMTAPADYKALHPMGIAPVITDGAMPKDRSERAFALVENRLGGVPYFAGEEFTAADIMMFFPLSTMRAFTQRDLSRLPHIRAYLKRIGERPAYQRAMAKGDPGMSAMLN